MLGSGGCRALGFFSGFFRLWVVGYIRRPTHAHLSHVPRALTLGWVGLRDEGLGFRV